MININEIRIRSLVGIISMSVVMILLNIHDIEVLLGYMVACTAAILLDKDVPKPGV